MDDLDMTNLYLSAISFSIQLSRTGLFRPTLSGTFRIFLQRKGNLTHTIFNYGPEF